MRSVIQFSVFLFFSVCLIFADPTNGCELGENELFLTSTGDVLYNIPTDIAGIQFSIDGTTASAAGGGEAAGAGFVLQAAGSTVLGFSFSGATIGTDCGLLLSLTLAGEATGLSGMTFADSSANNIPVTYHIVADVCDSEIYDCAGVCDGTAVEDCAGTCDGDATDVGCGCGEDGPSGCDNVCGSTAMVDECGVCGGDGSSCTEDLHFNVAIEETGESTLFTFQDVITSLDIGDEIGLFDLNGTIDSDGNQGEILVGAGVWNGE